NLTSDDSHKTLFDNRSLVLLINGNPDISVTGSFAPANANLAFVINGARSLSPNVAKATGAFPDRSSYSDTPSEQVKKPATPLLLFHETHTGKVADGV
ncbi:MAG: hypothetical protein N2049_06620, partial [Anaerolineales bacterium]|nr:hypothetical protein [Anaerolineales bacterium]